MLPDDIVKMMCEVKQRRYLRHPMAKEVQKQLEKFENEYPEDDLPWYLLSMIISNPKDENDSVLDRMAVPVWESADSEIQKMWSYITRDENKDSLIRRYKDGKLNGHAQIITEMAIRAIEART